MWRVSAIILANLVLCGCAVFAGAPSVAPVALFGSEARHNVQAEVGARVRWRSGAECTLTAGRRFRVEEPSSRGDTAENRVHFTFIGPDL